MRDRQRGFSLIELLIVVAIILVIAAIAIPNLVRSRMAANEASAVASLRSVNTSQLVYQTSYTVGFASGLTNLSDGGAPGNCIPPTVPTPASACLLDSTLAAGTKNGYKFTYTAVSSGGVNTSYTVNADPIALGASGQRHFFTDQSNVIRANLASPASPSDPAI
jgi:prepilin-type N-terminal cleavage/methylation domain-containing protein